MIDSSTSSVPDRDGNSRSRALAEEDRLAGLGHPAGEALADPARERLDALVERGIEIAAPGHRDEEVAVDDVEAELW